MFELLFPIYNPTCYIGDVCGMPVAFVGLEGGKPVIKPPLLSWEMYLSLHPTCVLLRLKVSLLSSETWLQVL